MFSTTTIVRTWGLYVHVCKMETLQEAYRMEKNNDGATGVDGVTFEAIEESGRESFLKQIQDELVHDTYQPMRVRKKEIPKDGGSKIRVLSIPAIRDRVVQGALKLILEPIFEADFQSGSYGYRPKRTAQEAVLRVDKAIMEGKTRVIDLDLRAYFDNVQHYLLLAKVAQRVQDAMVMKLLNLILKSTGKKGVPQGGVVTPRTQKITSNLTARSSWSVGHGTANDTSSNLDICRIWLYLYVICLAPVPLRGHNASIAHAPCCSVAVHSPQQFSSLPKCAPFPLARPIAISGRPSA